MNAARRRAMTLIELIGVLAVLAVLAAFLLPSGIRYLDRVALDKETAYLQSLSDAFQGAILRNRAIPAANQWPGFIANQTGADLGAVTVNPRGNNRAFLFDKAGWLNTGLPYTQTNTSPPGLASVPANPRIMIVSSLGAALPAGLNNTAMTAGEFNALWNVAPRAVPSGSPWTGWAGRGDDLVVQRLNLSPLFHRVVLSTYLGTNLGLYRVETNFYLAPSSNLVSRFYLKNTPMDLFASAPTTNLNLTFLVERDTSYVYENGSWRKTILGAAAAGMGDASGIVDAFLRAPGNIRAANTNPSKIQQQIIVEYFIQYMSNYNKWEDTNFKDNALKSKLDTLQPQMIAAVEGLFQDAGSTKRYPTNPEACTLIPP